MSDYKLARDERETIIRWTEVDDHLDIETWSQPMVRRLRKLAPQYNAAIEDIGFDGVRVSLPRKALTLRKPRIMTDEQKRIASDRMKSLAKNREKTNGTSENGSGH